MSKIRTEDKNGQLIIYFPGRIWAVIAYLVTLPIYMWFFTGLPDQGAMVISIFILVYLLLAYLFARIYHSSKVVVDGNRKRIIQTEVYYIYNPAIDHNAAMLKKIVLRKHVGKYIKYLIWAEGDREKYIIGNQISSADAQQAKEIAEKIAGLLKIELEIQE